MTIKQLLEKNDIVTYDQFISDVAKLKVKNLNSTQYTKYVKMVAEYYGLPTENLKSSVEENTEIKEKYEEYKQNLRDLYDNEVIDIINKLKDLALKSHREEYIILKNGLYSKQDKKKVTIKVNEQVKAIETFLKAVGAMNKQVNIDFKDKTEFDIIDDLMDDDDEDIS